MEGLIVDTDTFVIVGAWNREILSQEWVMQNLRRRWKRRFVALLTDVNAMLWLRWPRMGR